MGFLDKAKALGEQAMAKADTALNSIDSSTAGGVSAKQAEPYLRDLGVLAYLEQTGRSPADAGAQRDRCLQAISQIESQTALNLAMTSAAPPPPGQAAAARRARRSRSARRSWWAAACSSTAPRRPS